VKVADAPSIVPVDPDAVAATRPVDPEREYRENLQEAATKLNITGSFPKRKQIMVGAKNLSVGDEIAIRFKENHYDLEILDITSSELKLRDQQSKLEVSVAIGMSLSLPPGMSRKPPPGTFKGGDQPNASPPSGERQPQEAN